MRSIMNVKTNQKGFTLIELVVVIVILGILAVTAVPKFIDLTSDARVSAMKAVQGNIESAVSIAQSKALIEGQTGATGEVTIGGTVYALVFGYPAVAADGDFTGTGTGNGLGVAGLVEVSGDIDSATLEGTYTHTSATTPASCKLVYTNAANSSSRPTIVLTDTGC